MVRFPAPLRPGGTIAVTAPSSGVPDDLRPRLEAATEHLRRLGFEVRLGRCMDGSGVVSASASERAAELTEMLLDPDVGAVVPPWGGELAVELLPHLDLDALADGAPAWLVGYSDLSTLTMALTTATGWSTVHGPNLMDTPDRVPVGLVPWPDVVTAAPGTTSSQTSSTHHRAEGARTDWVAEPTSTDPGLGEPGRWSLLDPAAGPVRARGRLVGGCLECVSTLAGTPWGDVRSFAEQHAPDGVLVHVEAAESHALDVARMLWRLRLAGWFEHATAVLVGRTHAPSVGSFSQVDALRSALDGLDLPVVLDVDSGHVPPQMPLVQGAAAEVVVAGDEQSLTQTLA